MMMITITKDYQNIITEMLFEEGLYKNSLSIDFLKFKTFTRAREKSKIEQHVCYQLKRELYTIRQTIRVKHYTYIYIYIHVYIYINFF